MLTKGPASGRWVSQRLQRAKRAVARLTRPLRQPGMPRAPARPDAGTLCSRAQARARQAWKKGGKFPPEIEAAILKAEAAHAAASPALDEADTASRQLLHAKLYMHVARRHAARVFHLAELTQWEQNWDSEALRLLLEAHALVGTPYMDLGTVFLRLESELDASDVSALRDQYLEKIGDVVTRLRREFAAVAADADRQEVLRKLVLDVADASITQEVRESLLELAESAVVGHPHGLGPDAAVLAMNAALTLEERRRALELYNAVRAEARGDRGLHARFQKFYVELIYFLHTGGEAASLVQPLEQEEWWTRYNRDYVGMEALTSSPYWRDITKEEAGRRALFAPPAPRAAPNEIVFVSNTPKFSFPLMDLVRAHGIRVHAVQFNFVEDIYRRNRMIDLIARPLQFCASVGIRKQLLGHPLVKRVAAAECILVDFANRAAVWASWFKRPGQRLIIRLHAYEALSAWPYLINWAAVDGLVFVSPAIEAIFRRELGERLAHVPSVVIPNFKVLPDPPPSRAPGRTLGMLGAVIYRKQPVQAVQILKALQERDSPEWSLRLAGDYWPPETRPPETEHKAEFDRLVAALPNPGSVVIEGFQDDIGAWFSGIDFLLSCSLREGTHEAVNEAMHFNTIPIVRDWPLVEEFGGARCVYPVLEKHGLLYSEVDQAVECVLAARQSHARTQQAMRKFVRTYLDNDRNLKTLLDFIGSV